MSGLALSGLLAVASLAVLWLLRVRGVVLGLAAGALLLGTAASVVEVGRRANTPQRLANSRKAAPDLAVERHAFFGNFTPAERWLILADSYAQSGDTMGAAQVVQSAVRAHPEDAQLWVGLGNALVAHAGTLSPASRFAFYRAIELAPGSPAPRFFLALAMLRSGDRDDAVAELGGILTTAPLTTSWRPMVERALAIAAR